MSFFDFNGRPVKDMQVDSFTAHKGNVYQLSGQMRGLSESLDDLADLIITQHDQLQEEIDELKNAQKSQNLHNGLIWRTIDGSGNNLQQPQYGKVEELLLRNSPPDYDPVQQVAIRGATNPNPRRVSNAVCQGVSQPSAVGLSDLTWAWGQFIDHEIVITHTQTDNPETLNIITDAKDPNEPFNSQSYTIPFTRSVFRIVNTVREQPNSISSFLDGTNVYGDSTIRAYALRRLDGTGKLKTTLADNGEILLPYNTEGLENASLSGQTPSDLFLAGDIRSNENTVLTSMHTVFVREHNRLCDEIVAQNPSLAGEDELIYQKARRIVIGFTQQITYGEFLPALLGSFPPYTGYNSTINPGIATEFSTVGFRFGHTMLSSTLQVGTNPANTTLLRNNFFTPSYIQTNGIDDLLIGASRRSQQEIDSIIVEDVRSMLFGQPAMGIMHDLAAINIQRGRDHGIGGYNAVRAAYGLSTFSSFNALPMPQSVRDSFATIYLHPDSIDPWVGAISETHLPGKSVGALLNAILVDQFERLRSGDRFWYEIDPGLTEAEKTMIRSTRLGDILTRNTSYTFSSDAFHV